MPGFSSKKTCVKQRFQSQYKSQTFPNGNLAGSGAFPAHPAKGKFAAMTPEHKEFAGLRGVFLCFSNSFPHHFFERFSIRLPQTGFSFPLDGWANVTVTTTGSSPPSVVPLSPQSAHPAAPNPGEQIQHRSLDASQAVGQDISRIPRQEFRRGEP